MSSTNTVYNGMVKWFSNKLGYGFIRVVDNSDRHNDDIFVHQSRVVPNVSEYRTLKKGEYVSFEILPDTKREWQANHVTGLYGGPLMCDTYHRPRRTGGEQSESNDNSNSAPESN